MVVNIIGLGYIGLPTALMFASRGVSVVGTDYNEKIVNTLNAGEMTFDEKGLDAIFDSAVSNGIKFTTQYVNAELYIVAVPTPYIKESKKIEPRYVEAAVESILQVSPKGAIIIIESTISPGTIDKCVRPIVSKFGLSEGEDVHLVHAPERIIPGNMVYELMNNARTIGCDDNLVGQVVCDLYKIITTGEIIVTDIRTAELTKIVENTYRDINIAFANELAQICRRDNLDVYETIRIANKHPRVNILQPGPGVGGHCISVDPWFLVGDYPDLVNIILAARNINDNMPQYVLKRIRQVMKENNLKDISRIGLYGLTYKENIDDTRESPTLQLLEKMDEQLVFGVKSYDPLIKRIITNNQYLDFEDFVDSIDIIVIMVSHNHLMINQDKIKDKVILDTKNSLTGGISYKL